MFIPVLLGSLVLGLSACATSKKNAVLPAPEVPIPPWLKSPPGDSMTAEIQVTGQDFQEAALQSFSPCETKGTRAVLSDICDDKAAEQLKKTAQWLAILRGGDKVLAASESSSVLEVYRALWTVSSGKLSPPLGEAPYLLKHLPKEQLSAFTAGLPAHLLSRIETVQNSLFFLAKEKFLEKANAYIEGREACEVTREFEGSMLNLAGDGVPCHTAHVLNLAVITKSLMMLEGIHPFMENWEEAQKTSALARSYEGLHKILGYRYYSRTVSAPIQSTTSAPIQTRGSQPLPPPVRAAPLNSSK